MFKYRPRGGRGFVVFQEDETPDRKKANPVRIQFKLQPSFLLLNWPSQFSFNDHVNIKGPVSNLKNKMNIKAFNHRAWKPGNKQ